MQVFEGGVTWGCLRDAEIDEIEFLYEQAEEVNQRRKSEMKAAQSRARVRGRRY